MAAVEVSELGVGGGHQPVGAVPLVEPLPGGGVGDDHARGSAVHPGVGEDLVEGALEAGVGGACPGGRAPGECAGEPDDDGPDPAVALQAPVGANHGSTHGTGASRTGCAGGKAPPTGSGVGTGMHGADVGATSGGRSGVVGVGDMRTAVSAPGP